MLLPCIVSGGLTGGGGGSSRAAWQVLLQWFLSRGKKYLIVVERMIPEGMNYSVSFEPTWEVFYVPLGEVFLVLKTAIAEQFVFPRRPKPGRVFGPGAVDPFTPVLQTFHGFVLNNSGVEGQNRRCCSVHVTVAPELCLFVSAATLPLPAR